MYFEFWTGEGIGDGSFIAPFRFMEMFKFGLWVTCNDFSMLVSLFWRKVRVLGIGLTIAEFLVGIKCWFLDDVNGKAPNLLSRLN